MNEVNGYTWHVSRRVALPLDVAAATLDRVLDRPAPSADPDATTRGLTSATVAVTPLPGTVRRWHGALRVAPWPTPIAVELELEPWSASQSSLGLRPRRRPPRWRAGWYWESAVSALERLDAELIAAAPRQRGWPVRLAS